VIQATPDVGDASASFWLPLLVTSTAIFIFGIDAGLMSVALPDIEETFTDTPRATISWVGTGYSVAGVSLLLVAGRLGDRMGRRRIFRVGMVLFGLGSVVAGVAPNPFWLITGRVIGGGGAAFFTATGLAIAMREIPASRKASAVGVWGVVGATGFIVGPVGGGAVIELWNWRVAFVLVAPIAFLASFVVGRVARESFDRDRPEPINVVDVVLGATGVASVAVALSQSGRWGWSDGRVVGLIVVGSALLTVLVLRSNRDGALVDRRLWAYRPYVIATAGASLQQFGFLPWFVALSFVLRGVWGWSVLETGYGLSLGMVVSAITAFYGGRLADRFGYVGVVSVGTVVAALGPLWWIIRMDTETDFWITYLPGVVLFMFGSGAAGVLPTGAALQNIPVAALGSANATHSTVRRLCASMGLAVMAALLGEGSGAELLNGAKAVFVMVIIAYGCLVPFMIWYGRVVRATESGAS
jgi:MFS family permease